MTTARIPLLRSLRLWLPGLLVVLAGVGSVILYWVEVGTRTTAFEAQFKEAQLLRTARLQGEVERWVQRNDPEMVQSVLAETGIIPELKAASFLDGANVVLAASRREYIGRPAEIQQFAPSPADQARLLTAMQATRETKRGNALYTGDRCQLVACFPMTVWLRPGELQAHRTGLLLASYDPRPARAANLQHLRRDFASDMAGVLFMALILGISLHFLVSRRLEQVKANMAAFAAGRRIDRTPAPLGDEISYVADRFTEMATTVEREMAERRQAEEAVRKTAAEMQDLYDHAPCGYHSLDQDGVIVRINDTELAWLGYTREELLGKRKFTDLLTPASAEVFRREYPGFKARGWVHDLGFDLRRKDGTLLPILVNATAITDASGNFLMSRSVVHDITERKRHESLNAARLHLVQFSLTHSLDELLEETLNEAENLTGSLIGFYHFVEEDQKSLTLQNWSTRTKAVFCKAEGKGSHYAIDAAGVWVDCMHQRKAVIHNDYASLSHRKGMPAGHATVIRELVVPVFRGEKVVAILGVGNKPADYSEKDIEVVSLLADLAWDIAERKRLAELLHQRAQEFQTLVENSPDIIARYDRECRRTYVNPTYLKVAGIPEEKLLGATPAKRSPLAADVAAALQQLIRRVIDTGVPAEMDLPLQTPGHGQLWFAVSIIPEVDHTGRVASAMSISRDITARKQAEAESRQLNAELEQRVRQRTQELAESESRFRTIYETAPVSIWQEDWTEVIAVVANLRRAGVTDFEAYFREHPDFVVRALKAVKIQDVNQWTLGMFGAKDKAAMLASLETVFATPDTLPGFIGELMALAQGQAVYQTELRLNTVKGGLIHALLALAFPPPGVNSGKVLVSLIDITGRKQAEEALRHAEEQHRRLFETTLQGVVYQSAAGVILSMNPAAIQILGKTPEELLGRTSADEEHHTIHADGSRYPAADHPAMVSLRTGQPVRDVLMGVYNPRQRAYRWINVNAVPLFRAGEDKPGEVYTIFDDVTERKAAEEDIQQLNQELRQRAALLEVANKELESFSYSVSHDLRAPLRSIDGFSRILLEDCGGKLGAEGKENLQRVRAASQRMGQLIDDLLVLARVTRAELQRSEVDLSALAAAVAGELRSEYPDRAVTLVIEPGLTAVADRNLMRTVLENLLGNAWKFTARQAAARIEFGRAATAAGPAFFVRDDGAGFDPAFGHKLFQAFQRLHTSEEFPGTGIGLATVQRIIRRHGGRVWAESGPGRGATFHFTLSP